MGRIVNDRSEARKGSRKEFLEARKDKQLGKSSTVSTSLAQGLRKACARAKEEFF